jgi:predicted ATP-dependent serine protease
MLIHGEPGVGKTALLMDLTANAGDARVLHARGVESEAPLAFAALHGLLRPVLGTLDRLPVPQARALRVAFGQEDGVTVDPFLVALGTLSILTEAAEEAPVLCVIDDAQWLDSATAQAVLVAGWIRQPRRPCWSPPGGWRRTASPWCSPPGTLKARRSRPKGYRTSS